jgi:lantibiotic transport system permease protein
LLLGLIRPTKGTIQWKSFGAPFALNVILTIPAVAVVHSHHYGPIYPWAQPLLAMLPARGGFIHVTFETSLTIVISGVVLIIAGWWHFVRRDMYA